MDEIERDDRRSRSMVARGAGEGLRDAISTLGYIVGIALLFVLAVGIFLVQKYLWIVGIIFLIGVGLGSVILLIAGVIWVMGLLNAGEFVHIGQFGTAHRTRFGRVKLLAPLNLASPKTAGATTEVAVEIPALAALIKDNLLIDESFNILLGYRANSAPRYGAWPKTFGIGGIGNSGKSVTALYLILIALLQRAKVTVCDPHRTKERSLYKKLKPLERWIEFASTPNEILAVSERYSAELQARKSGAQLPPHLIVYDELTSMIKRTPEISKQIVKVIESASQEGMGFDMYVMAICHSWDKDSIGDVAIRQALNAAFIHHLDAGQSKFLLSDDKKLARLTVKLLPGHCLYRDEYGEVEELTIPYGTVREAQLVAEILERDGVPGLNGRVWTPLPPMAPFPLKQIPEQIARHSYSPVNSPDAPTVPLLQHQTGPLVISAGEAVNSVNTPIKPDEAGETLVNAHKGEQGVGEAVKPLVSADEENLILSKIILLQQRADRDVFFSPGGKVYRTKLRDALEWNNKQYPKVAAVCDKYGL